MTRCKFLPTNLKNVQQKNSTGILVRKEVLLCDGEVQTAVSRCSAESFITKMCTPTTLGQSVDIADRENL